MYQTIVIGGGPSGIMAAISASQNNQSVLLIEKKKGLGRKLKISGGGRCNVTNNLPYDEIIQNIPGNGKFLYSPFSLFDNQSIIQFFESRGLKLKEEDHGRMFPVTDKSQDVLDVLTAELHKQHVEVIENSPVSSITASDDCYTVTLQNGTKYQGHTAVIATGGTSVPHTGSTGDGYQFAKAFGHTITDLFPTEVPIRSNEAFIREQTLKGLSLKNVALSVLRKNGKKRITHQMDMLFTHFGISGPAALRCSQFVYKEQQQQKRQDIQMQLDVFPHINEEQVKQKIIKLLKKQPDKIIKNALKGIIETRYLHFMLERATIDLETTYHHLSMQQINDLAHQFKAFTFTVNGTLPLEKAFVTGGGVSIKEIVPTTMASKIQDGLFLCGEVLDIHGYTGGYNITSALVTGYVAGYYAGTFGMN
ncbi:NAD(P)/FAD-dependent oxidoreductase [Staphylococcus americanisciuri]|uniref:NAD(P)/FAD-dependent oxidoreductase n=1 Tax=Staphylococcus americanisciuri TaxID=2973940 RepID=A0ABT2F0F0_9STAP|nr:NAD(P)/FAD-dependent oxidoreductase [Staphylococcus americanisciuri]MCS4485307.1 NAD(P)/FAD-dependent oxidoreductase [Staphylococcus americanisciuri]